MSFPQKVKSRTSIESSNAVSECLSEENKDTNLEKKCSHVHCNIIYNTKIRKQPKCSLVDEQIKKMGHIYTCYIYYIYIIHNIYLYILFSHEKEYNFAIYNNVYRL